MTKIFLSETIKRIENTQKERAQTQLSDLSNLFDLVNFLPEEERAYFNEILKKRGDLELLLDSDLSTLELEKGLLYNIAFHSLLHQENAVKNLEDELAVTLKTFDLIQLLEVNLADLQLADLQLIEKKLIHAYSGMLLLSEQISFERAEIERALLKEFSLGAALQPGLWGYSVNVQNFKTTLAALKLAPVKSLLRFLKQQKALSPFQSRPRRLS